MKKILFSLFLILPVFFTQTACQKEGFVLKGKFENAANLQISMEEFFFSGKPAPNPDKVSADADGSFKIEKKEGFHAGLYRMSIGAKKMFLVLDGTEKAVEITGNMNTLDKLTGVTVAGSSAGQCYVDRVREIIAVSETGQMNPQSMKTIVDKGCNPFLVSLLSMQLMNMGGFEYMADFAKYGEALNKFMPGSSYAKDYAVVLQKAETMKKQQEQLNGPAAAGSGTTIGGGTAGPIALGVAAPEISYPDPAGTIRSLSSLKGKVVLLDFWASWCGPCRRENPNVVNIYKKYKAKGFEVFSVSLDKEAGAWKNAIAQDGLEWPNHVSDLKHWQSAPAQLYGVNSIPRTFLIGKDGKIVAINPRQNLEQELLKLL